MNTPEEQRNTHLQNQTTLKLDICSASLIVQEIKDKISHFEDEKQLPFFPPQEVYTSTLEFLELEKTLKLTFALLCSIHKLNNSEEFYPQFKALKDYILEVKERYKTRQKIKKYFMQLFLHISEKPDLHFVKWLQDKDFHDTILSTIITDISFDSLWKPYFKTKKILAENKIDSDLVTPTQIYNISMSNDLESYRALLKAKTKYFCDIYDGYMFESKFESPNYNSIEMFSRRKKTTISSITKKIHNLLTEKKLDMYEEFFFDLIR
jgi:hypothetical protein